MKTIDQLFETVSVGDQDMMLVPLVISDSLLIPAGHRADVPLTLDFGGHPGTADRHLFDHPENLIVDSSLKNEIILYFYASQAGFAPGACWFLIGDKRHELLPRHREGKPGDFDIIVGPVRGGILCFDNLGEIEVKIRKVDADGRPKSTASGSGTKQGYGAAEVGFDRVLLLHLLVREPSDVPPGCARSWSAMHNADFGHPMRATANLVRKATAGRPMPFGYAQMGISQIPGTDPSLSGGLSVVPVEPPPVRPLNHRDDVRQRRVELEHQLGRLLGERRPAERFFRRCDRCGRLFGLPTVSRTCPGCTPGAR